MVKVDLKDSQIIAQLPLLKKLKIKHGDQVLFSSINPPVLQRRQGGRSNLMPEPDVAPCHEATGGRFHQ
ncbi:unnamed protein product [Sphagnum jensenii]|jgi:hypothetical protein